jgi:hypothetical protein
MKAKCEFCNADIPERIVQKVHEFFLEVAADYEVPTELIEQIRILCPRCALLIALPPKGMAA